LYLRQYDSMSVNGTVVLACLMCHKAKDEE
jgi:hypothetical protein